MVFAETFVVVMEVVNVSPSLIVEVERVIEYVGSLSTDSLEPDDRPGLIIGGMI